MSRLSRSKMEGSGYATDLLKQLGPLALSPIATSVGERIAHYISPRSRSNSGSGYRAMGQGYRTMGAGRKTSKRRSSRKRRSPMYKRKSSQKKKGGMMRKHSKTRVARRRSSSRRISYTRR